MAIAAAALALIERVEPNWLISSTTSDALIASSLSPGPSWPNNSTQLSGRSYCSIFLQPGTLSMAMIGSLFAFVQAKKSSTVGWWVTCW